MNRRLALWLLGVPSLFTLSIAGCGSESTLPSADGNEGGAPAASGGSATNSGGSPVIASGGTTTQPTDWSLDDQTPADASAPTWLNIQNPIVPTAFWGELPGPYPTNTWWLNLVLDTGSGSAFPFPYTYSWSNEGLTFGHPDRTTTADTVYAPLTKTVSVGAVETFASRVVSAYDELSVTLRWDATAGSMSSPLVAGSPYATLLFDQLTPQLSLAISGTGKRFEVTADGVTYLVYASSELTFSAGQASAPFSGWLRIAKVPGDADAAVLDQYSGAVVYGGAASFSKSGTTGLLTLSFDTQGTGTPLMMALPHHLERVQGRERIASTFSLTTLKGPAQGLSAPEWVLEYPLTDVSFQAPRAIDPTMVAELKTALAADSSYDPDAQDSVYWSGKALSKLARLALIADELGETGARDTLLDRLRTKEKAWLDRLNTGTSLAYDTTWGGVVNECVLDDTSCDFGQGIYSDHHFHYGYHVYASAVLAKLDPSFATDYRQKVEWLIRDYANPYRNDPYFTRLRHFDIYHGHSWTSGLIVFGDGRNQESTSEAVNSYYGLQLWGEATANADLANVGHILRIAESVGAQNYWHIADESVYSAPFSAHACAGIVWGSKVDYATWFGLGDYGEQVCGIQMIPITPASEDLLDVPWVDAVWQGKLGPIAAALDLGNGWRDFFAAALANTDRAAGCAMIRAQTAHDDGNSLTNMLHYCATRAQ